MTSRHPDFDIELPLLIEAIYLKYHYDFRQYARASLKRRLTAALGHFDCPTLSQLQDRVLQAGASRAQSGRRCMKSGLAGSSP